MNNTQIGFHLVNMPPMALVSWWVCVLSSPPFPCSHRVNTKSKYGCPIDMMWMTTLVTYFYVAILHGHNLIQFAWLCYILYFASNMHLHYLTFMRRNLENRRKLTPIRIMIVLLQIIISGNNNWFEHCFLQMVLGWTVIRMHSVGSISPLKFSSSPWMHK